MQPVHYDANLCVMTRFSGLIMGKWKPIILHLVECGIDRFSAMQSHMPTISKKILTEQLRELETDGLISRQELKAKAPKIVVYRLTPQGTSLRRLIDEIIAWTLTYLKDEIPDDVVDVYINTHPDLAKRLPWLKHKRKDENLS
ncbi:winged helix-turn-helix transcriptional regulator [Chitinophaga sp.]|uniref:winged helix-turn-helix transcriptional regulator n=1 Tax=Chitinophaga sp. TaxID=1869181 RepID=UPI0031DCAC65